MDDALKSLGVDAAALVLSGLFRMAIRSRWNDLCQNTFTIDFDIQPLAC